MASAAKPERPELFGGKPLYPWQREALERWRANRGCGIVEAVTGAGKTAVGIVAIREERDLELRPDPISPGDKDWFGIAMGLQPK
jgi:superfamily II DNA or RNA helicase